MFCDNQSLQKRYYFVIKHCDFLGNLLDGEAQIITQQVICDLSFERIRLILLIIMMLRTYVCTFTIKMWSSFKKEDIAPLWQIFLVIYVME
ncbi:hypothetical protein T4D_9046 [Trichinella pseudospiralis]|uniref:Uncharacterized protein n=1 Tax=Trichinella pseudospiralis TaxID=6337 RepID=A0A0V1G402_TRIPS|nr:hypothetical protein T4D_9046 [Trichinella pseudospiralis]